MAVKIPSESEELTGKQIMICIFFRREKKSQLLKLQSLCVRVRTS